jgi:hypothetical protein
MVGAARTGGSCTALRAGATEEAASTEEAGAAGAVVTASAEGGVDRTGGGKAECLGVDG